MTTAWPISKKSSLLIGISFLFLCVVVYWPADAVTARVSALTHEQLRFTQVAGTCWQGEADVVLSNGQAFKLGHLAWQSTWSSIWRGRLSWDFSWNQQPLATATVSIGAVEIKQLHLPLLLSDISQAISGLSIVSPGGKLLIESEHFSIASDQFNGDILLHLDGLYSGLTPISPLGQYEMLIRGEQQAMLMHLRTTQGPLWIEAKGKWSPPSGFKMLGNAHAEPRHAEALSPLLHLMGNEAQPGQFVFQF